MTLQIQKLPTVIFTGNPAEVVFLKKSILAATGGYAELLLMFDRSDAPADTNTLVFDINGVASALTFTFGDVTADPLTLPFYTSGDFDVYLKLLANAIYAHPDIRANYFVKYVSLADPFGSIQIIARNRGTVYNIEVNVASTVYLDSATAAITITDDDATLTNYKLTARVSVITDAEYNATQTDYDHIEATGVVNPDADSMPITFYDLPEIGRVALGDGVDIPDNPYLMVPHRKTSGKLLIEVNEDIAGIGGKSQLQAAGDLGSTVSTLLIKGGMMLRTFDYENTFNTWKVSDDTRFFTFQPRKKIITKEQPEWLSFPVYDNSGAGFFSIEYRIKYANGSTHSKTVNKYYLQSGIWMIPSGFDQNMLSAVYGGSNPISYMVVVSDEDSGDSEEFFYVLDQRYFKDERYFLFQNALGGIDTLRCVGVNAFSVKYTRQTNSYVLTSNSREDRGSIQMILNERENIWTMRTGWLLSQEEKEFLLQLLNSTYIAEVILPLLQPVVVGDATKYYKQPYRSCILLDDTLEMFDEAQGTWALEWKMKYANNETAYSNIAALKEVWTDTLVEFMIELTDEDVSGGPVSVDFTTNSECVAIIGMNTNPDAGLSLSLSKSGVYKFKFAASACTEFTLQCGAGTITFSTIETMSIQTFILIGFSAFADDYLCRRIETFYSLQTFWIWCNTDPGFNLNRMLMSLNKLYNAGFGQLSEVDFSYATPNTQAALLKLSLVSSGVTVTTL